ncbi:MAG TPA: hypothetical protein VL966_11020 [Alphaproteobacteria bacterium]|nr:hypothetical protein [Alphaproteobacteria bacterium]
MANEARAHSAAPEQDAPVWPNGDWRVSDKLLAAHNHAYVAGNRAVANEIRDILALVSGDDEPVRRLDPLERAKRWIAFVDAREAYEDAVNDVDRGRLQATRLRLHMAQELWRKGEEA